MKKFKMDARLFWLATAALAMLIVAGCGDDPVTPNEEPTFTEEDAAKQSAFISVGMVQVLDDLAEAKASPVEQTLDEEYVYGSYLLAEDGNRVYTNPDDPLSRLTIDFDGSGSDVIQPATLLFDISATGDPRLATGTGTLLVGALTITFAVTNIEVAANNYPTDGQLIVTTSGYTATVQFFPNHTAYVTVGTLQWSVDLENGDIAPAD